MAHLLIGRLSREVNVDREGLRARRETALMIARLCHNFDCQGVLARFGIGIDVNRNEIPDLGGERLLSGMRIHLNRAPSFWGVLHADGDAVTARQVPAAGQPL